MHYLVSRSAARSPTVTSPSFAGQTVGEQAAWLRQVLARNLANVVRDLRRDKRDVAREQGLQAALDESASRLEAWLAAEQSSPSQLVERQERAVRLAEALAALPENQRKAVVLRHWHGCSLIAQSYRNSLGFEPQAIYIRAREERGTEASAHVVLTGRAATKEHRYKDAVTLRQGGPALSPVVNAQPGTACWYERIRLAQNRKKREQGRCTRHACAK
jgi:hypothetical protein